LVVSGIATVAGVSSVVVLALSQLAIAVDNISAKNSCFFIAYTFGYI
jgi:hypothetical protein